MKKNAIICSALALAALLSSTAISSATAVLELSDGMTTVTITDGGAGDMSAAAGAVTFNGTVGTWIVNVTTGVTKPTLGSAASPKLDLNSIHVSGGAGNLTIRFSDTGYTQNGTAENSVGGTLNNAAGSTINFSTYYDAGNTALAQTTLLTSQTFGPGSFSGDQTGGPVVSATPYSLTIVATLHHSAVGSSSYNDLLTVPDGGSTVTLLGGAIIALGAFRRKIKSVLS